MDKIAIYKLDQYGVIVDTDRINAPEGSWSKLQNAIPDPIGSQGNIRKRPGLAKFTTTAGAGTVTGGIGVPILLGSAGPDFLNPFTNTNFDPFLLATTPNPLGGTYDDESFNFNFDFNFDFAEADETAFVPADGVITPAGEQVVLPTSTYPWQGINFPNTLLSINADTGSGPGLGGGWLRQPSAANGSNNVFLSTRLAAVTSIPGNFSYMPFPLDVVRSGVSLAFLSSGNADEAQLLGRPFVVANNKLYYAGDTYTPGTNAPYIRVYDGYTDNILCSFAPGGTPLKAIMTMFAIGSTLYVCTVDSGTTASNVVGSVYQVDGNLGNITKLGTSFSASQVPYSLIFAYGKLWLGTANFANLAGAGAAPQVWWIRPGIDTAWTQDTNFSPNSDERAVTSLALFQGQLYAATTADDHSATVNVYVRSTLDVWSSSDSANNGSDVGAGYQSLLVAPREGLPGVTGAALYATFFKYGSPATSLIRVFNGSSWSTSYTAPDTAHRVPYLLDYGSADLPGVTLSIFAHSMNQFPTAVIEFGGSQWTDILIDSFGGIPGSGDSDPVFATIAVKVPRP